MTRILLLLLLPLCAIAAPRLDYRLSYSPHLQRDGLKVELAYRQPAASDSTLFTYTDELWGATHLFRSLVVDTLDNPGCRFRLVPDSNRIVLYHPRSRDVHFTYRIRQDYDEDTREAQYRPRVRDGYFHSQGQSLFVLPAACYRADQDPEIDVRIHWTGFPDSFRIHNTFATGQREQRLRVKVNSEFYNSLFVGGDYRILGFEAGGKRVYLAIRDRWLNPDLEDVRLAEAARLALNTQREFWNDRDFPYYTVIISPTKTDADTSWKGHSSTGTSVHGGFVIESTNTPYTRFGIMRYLFNHEMNHDWIGGKIPMEHEELNYWFSEGFTDYYTYKNRLRSGDLAPKQWLADFNKDVLKAHWENPVRSRPNYVIKDSFWKSREVEKIPYRRGALFAFWLDHQIQKKTNGKQSLDDLMRDLLKLCVEDHRKFSDELFLSAAKPYLDQDLSYFFQKHILNGVDFDWRDGDLPEGFGVERGKSYPQLTATEDAVRKYAGGQVISPLNVE